MQNKPDTVVILDQASGYLQLDMLEAYAEKYPHRGIVAGTIVERGTPLAPEVKWHRITKYNRSTTGKRLYTWLAGTMGMFWVVLKQYRKAHIVAITNPPFSIFVPWLLGCSYDVVVYDMYPDALVHYGYTKKSGIIYRSWAALNKKVFAKANRVITLTQGMAALVNAYMPEDRKAEIIPLWSDAADFQEIPRAENRILQQTNSIDKFTIVYSGNLGTTHPVEKLVELAECLDADKFAVIIIGEGAKKKRLEELCAVKNLPHVHLLPWQPVEYLSHNLYAGHINAVILDEQAGDLSIPSKTFNILSIGNPLLGICTEQSGLGRLITANGCGLIALPDPMKEVAAQLVHLEANPEVLRHLKENSEKSSLLFSKKNAKRYL